MELAIRPWLYIGLGLLNFCSAAWSIVGDISAPAKTGKFPLRQPAGKVSVLGFVEIEGELSDV